MKNKPNKDLQAQMAQQEAAKMRQRELEKKELRYRIARADFNITLLDIGIMEEPVLRVTKQGVVPYLELAEVPTDQIERMKKELTDLKADLVKMSGEPSPILGADGEPAK